MTLNIEILNPKAKQLLEDLEALDLIRIKQSAAEELNKLAEKIRARVDNPPSFEEINQMVKEERAKIYAEKQAKNHH